MRTIALSQRIELAANVAYYMNSSNNVNDSMKVSTAEFIKGYGALADKALSEPITITKNGRDRLVVISAEEYLRLKSRDRRVLLLEDFTAAEMATIARGDTQAADADLDAELKDWKP